MKARHAMQLQSPLLCDNGDLQRKTAGEDTAEPQRRRCRLSLLQEELGNRSILINHAIFIAEGALFTGAVVESV